MPKQRRKIVKAGRLWMAVQYTNLRSGPPGQRREAKAQISTPARESLNAKTSWQKLMLLLAANLTDRDLVVTLSYRDADLPLRREEAERRMKNFIRQLRASRREHGQPLIYFWNIEGYHSGGRYHHHLIINSTGDDFETIRRLWAKNGDNIDFELFGEDGPERWGKYMTKEPITQGRRHIGERSWHASINLRKPEVESLLVPDGEELQPPPGAYVKDRTECENCYGRFKNLIALLPEGARNAGISDLG